MGDVDFEAVKEKAAAITPVPGGVGPDDDRDAAREHDEGGATSGGGAGVVLPCRWICAAALRRLGHGPRRRRRARRDVPRWYELPDAGSGEVRLTAWESFAVNDVILALAAVMAIAAFVLTATQPTAAVPLALASLTTPRRRSLALVLVTVRRRSGRPTSPDGARDGRETGAWLGLVATAVLAGGCLASIRDERLPRPRACRSSRGSCSREARPRRSRSLGALALLLVMAMDWYSTAQGDEARRIESVTEDARGGGRRDRARGQRGRAHRRRGRGEERLAGRRADRPDPARPDARRRRCWPSLTAVARAAGAKPTEGLGPAGLAAISRRPRRLARGLPDHPGARARRRHDVKAGAPLALLALAMIALGSSSRASGGRGGRGEGGKPMPELT